MKVGFSDTYTDPQIVLAELLTEPDAPSAIRYLEATVADDIDARQRRASARHIWRTMRSTAPVTDAELNAFAVKIAEHFKSKAEKAEGFLR
jgi:hypothetical protein